MSKGILICLLIFLHLTLLGQDVNLQFEELFHSNSKSEIILKGRKLILKYFVASEVDQVRALKDYLINEVEDQEYAAFYPVEHWLILYWTEEYESLISAIINVDPLEIERFQRKIKPQFDLLFEDLQSTSRSSRSKLEASINRAALSESEKDFLLLHLMYISASDDYKETTQKTLNTHADEFIANNPGSEFEAYVRNYIRFNYIPAKWSFAAELFTGFGMFTNELRDHFGDMVPFGFGMDIGYKKFTLYLRDFIGRGQTKVDISYTNGIWEKGSEYSALLPEASLGYLVFENKLWKFAPFVGISSTEIGPVYFDLVDNPELENAKLEFTTTFTLGMNVDIKLGQSKVPMFAQNPKQRYWLIRMRYAFNIPQLDEKYDAYSGNLHYLAVGFGRFFRKNKRDI